jgi:hypothetical protein
MEDDWLGLWELVHHAGIHAGVSLEDVTDFVLHSVEPGLRTGVIRLGRVYGSSTGTFEPIALPLDEQLELIRQGVLADMIPLDVDLWFDNVPVEDLVAARPELAPSDVPYVRGRPLPQDVQRDMAFYRVAVDFRNAIEQMQARHGRLDDPDHRWWGFGDLRRGRDKPQDPRDWSGDDGLAGSKVPKHPPPGAGEATVELDEPSEGIVA